MQWVKSLHIRNETTYFSRQYTWLVCVQMQSQADSTTPDEPGMTSTEETEESLSIAELAVKHPLQNTWALWYFKNDRTKDWSENLKVVAKFQFVEDFWA